MSTRTRIFLGILLIYAIGVGFFLYRAMADLDPRYRESAEESQVETAQLLASLIEQDLRAADVREEGGRAAGAKERDGAALAPDAVDTARLAALLRHTYARRFSAQIYRLHKTQVEFRVYVTDRDGRVLYDSTGRNTGADFSQRSDVARTLAGQYGARATRDVRADPLSSVLYVGALIHARDGSPLGVLTVGKPVRSFGQFIANARSRMLWIGIGSAVAMLLFALLFSAWLMRPFGLIRGYLRWLRAQPRLSLPRMAGAAIDQLRLAVHEMRDAVTGRSYVADYVQTFTHEVKSPLSAIRGAAELMQEADMPSAERERFLANIARETQRIQEIVDRMMELTALEARRALGRTERVALSALLEEAAASARAAAALRQVRVRVEVAASPSASMSAQAAARDGAQGQQGEQAQQTQTQPMQPMQQAQTEGDPFLLRRAVGNLLDNAIDFAPEGSEVLLRLQLTPRHAVITVRDHGPGIPDYARERVFQKFYSLARPHSQKKSTGLGLAFVREIVALHHGRVTLDNAPGGGALATLTLRRG